MIHQQPNSQPSGSPVGRAIAGFFRFLVRFLFVLVIGALVGAGVFYAVPWVYRNLIQPVQQNTARIAALDQKVDQVQDRLQAENLTLQERIADMEAEMTSLREASAVQVQDIEGAAEGIQQLDGRITEVEEGLEAQQQAAKATRSELEGAIADLEEKTDQIADQAGKLEGRLALLQTAQDLLKVRLLLLEENPRSARDTLTLATAHLEQAMPLMPEVTERLQSLQERMVELDQLIEDRSFRVGPELESLWADVMDLVLPAVAPPAAEEPTS